MPRLVNFGRRPLDKAAKVPPARERLERESDLLVDQLCAIDNPRLIEGPLAGLGSEEMRQVDAAIADVLVLGEEVSFGRIASLQLAGLRVRK